MKTNPIKYQQILNWQKEHPDRVKEHKKTYDATHKEKRKAYMRVYMRNKKAYQRVCNELLAIEY
jgi:hypothetical protein